MSNRQSLTGLVQQATKDHLQSLPTDQLLAEYLEERNALLFQELATRFSRVVFRRCLEILKNDDLAREAVQETYRRLIERGRSIRNHGAIGSWLYSTATKAALEIRRTEQRRLHREASTSTRTPDADLSGETAPERNETNMLVLAAIHALPERYRLPLELVYFDGMTHAQVALAISQSKGTVDSAIRRGLMRLKTELVKKGISSLGVIAALHQFAAADNTRLPESLLQASLRGAESAFRSSWSLSWLLPGLFKPGLVLTVAAVTVGIMMTAKLAPRPAENAASAPETKTVPPTLEETNRRILETSVLPHMIDELKSICSDGEVPTVTRIHATDCRVALEIDLPLLVKKQARIRVIYNTHLRETCVFFQAVGSSTYSRVDIAKPIVLARLSELSPAFEIRLPLEPLQKALRWLDLLPRDERSGEEWQRAQDRIRIAAAPYLGAWRDVNDANSRLDVFLRIDGTMQSTLHFGQFGPTFAELFVREDGTLDWSFNRNGCEYQWIDPGRILAKPGTNRRWQRVDLTPKP